jgi:hypothetical protein
MSPRACRSSCRRVLAAALLAALAPLPGAAAAEAAASFLDLLEERFAAWDADGDGLLEEGEVDALVVKPGVTGREAAAVAALKVFRRKIDPPLPGFTLGYFTEVMAWDLAPGSGDTSFDRAYRRYASRIASTRRHLFPDGPVEYRTLHQGDLGDCFFLAGVGAVLHRDPGEITRMIRDGDSGSFTVSFPGAKPVTVDPPTDAEIAMAASTDDHLLWPVVLELACGNVKSDALPADKQPEESTDTIARGGSPSSVLRLLTAHVPRVISMRQKDQAETILPRVRAALRESVPAKRLVVASTQKDTAVPPGLHAKHSYAVLGYDADGDAIRLWDPHGHTFKPTGPPGLANGYPVTHGFVEIPIPEFFLIFRAMTLETEEPIRK